MTQQPMTVGDFGAYWRTKCAEIGCTPGRLAVAIGYGETTGRDWAKGKSKPRSMTQILEALASVQVPSKPTSPVHSEEPAEYSADAQVAPKHIKHIDDCTWAVGYICTQLSTLNSDGIQYLLDTVELIGSSDKYRL